MPDSSQVEEFASVYGKEAVVALEEALMLQVSDLPPPVVFLLPPLISPCPDAAGQ